MLRAVAGVCKRRASSFFFVLFSLAEGLKQLRQRSVSGASSNASEYAMSRSSRNVLHSLDQALVFLDGLESGYSAALRRRHS
jgi:hypothetical protein